VFQTTWGLMFTCDLQISNIRIAAVFILIMLFTVLILAFESFHTFLDKKQVPILYLSIDLSLRDLKTDKDRCNCKQIFIEMIKIFYEPYEILSGL
jgi:hypothetical protein